MTISQNILQFNEILSHQEPKVPNGFRIINPFIGENKDKINKIANIFYNKYYNDNNYRYIILGSSPSRSGSAITGIPFEDSEHLEIETGISFNKKFSANISSQDFLSEIIMKYGGFKKFYSKFYMNFVCPVGLVKINSNGKEINYNYYENKELQNSLYDFMIDMLKNMIKIGINRTKCYCMGSGGNYNFLMQINEKYGFFNKIIPLEHPRFIMQYNSKNKDFFVEKYMKALSE